VLRDCEIIVVENVSRAESLSRGRSSDTRAKVVSIEASAGFGAACNLGVVTASNEHVLVMTEDVVVEEADLGRLASSFAEHDFGLFTPSLRREGDGPAQQQVVAQSSWWTELNALALGPLQPRDPLQSANAAENVSAAWVTGVLMLVRREEFCAIGGFDERFLLYYEHRELSARYQQVGLPIGATDAVKAVYSGGQSIAEDGEPAVDPMAWSVLAWLEFVALEHGQRRARLSWAAIRATHRIGERFARWGAMLGARRLRGMAHQLRAVDTDLNRICDAGDGARRQSYPVACQVINGVSNGDKR
jgi:GT2 family glycosyltransferase